MLMSAVMSRDAFSFHHDCTPVAVLWIPLERLFARTRRRRSPEGLRAWGSRRRAARPSSVLRVATRVEIGDEVALDVVQIAIDLRCRRDADEQRALALAADANGSEERVERPLAATGIDIGALRDDRVGRRREVLCRRHEEAVVVALGLVDHDEVVPLASSASESSAVMTPTMMRTTRPAPPR